MPISTPVPPPRERGRPPLAHAAFAVLMTVVALGHVVGIFTLNINWDEFALLERAERVTRTGAVQGGGRPGLGTLVLVPFAAACENAVDALRDARIMWAALVFAAAAAFWLVLRSVLPASRYRGVAIATALGLWVLVPAFLRSSLQVRTDQPAILLGLLGGLALIASQRKGMWALLSGALFGIGFLFSQKLVYVAALVGLLAIGKHVIEGAWSPRREGARAALACMAFLGIVLGYRAILSLVSEPPRMLPVEAQMRTFDYYRERFGWVFYRGMLPTLVPHLLVLAALPVVTVWWWVRNGATRGRWLAVGWAVLALGIAVAIFHAGRFPYFFMVLGLFPATLAALLLVPLLERFRSPTGRGLVLGVTWTPLALLALVQTAVLLEDSQARQRESLDFVERAFAGDARGFDGYSALACRSDPDPFPTLFTQSLVARFAGADSAAQASELIEEFRSRPVSFLIPPLPGEPYPEEVRDFWETHYVLYSGQVMVPGRELRGEPRWSDAFEAVVAAEYRWIPDGEGGGPLSVDGVPLSADEALFLDAGVHRLELPRGGSGILALALPEPPDRDPRPFFIGF